MRALVAGAGALLAAALVRELQKHGEVVALDRASLDVTDRRAVARAVADAAPDVVLNCAAYNAVDRAQEEAEAALAVNAMALLGLAEAARDAGAILVHYSTDFVFDGDTARPYTEQDLPNPRSVYGSSKLLGEWFAQEHARSYVLRVESLFGRPHSGSAARGSLSAIVRRIIDGDEVPVFTDRTVSPASTADVAWATWRLVSERHPHGVYHCVNSGITSWSEIAGTVATLLGTRARLRPITLDTANLPAPRPRFCALSNAKLAARGIVMPSWEDALRRYLLDRSPASNPAR